MKAFAVMLAVFAVTGIAVSQPMLTAEWSVASFIETCSEQYQYRSITPGPIVFDSAGDIIWIYRDRSSCRQPWNNFNLLKVRRNGTPDLSFFRKYDTPVDYYADILAVGGKIVYVAGPRYAVDSGRSIFVSAINIETGDTLWMRRWMPAGKLSYTLRGIAAAGGAVYVTANAYTTFGEPLMTGYAMALGKWDTTGKEQWTHASIQPFYQQFAGSIVATDSLVYVCGSRYSDNTPYYRGSGFVGAFDNRTGTLADSFYFSLKRRSSEYVPSLLMLKDNRLIVVGANSSAADAAIFAATFSQHLDSLSFYEKPLAYYYYYSPAVAAIDENGYLYIGGYQYTSPRYYLGLDMMNCRDGCYPIHSAIMLTPEPLGFGALEPGGGSLFVSMYANSPDSTLDVLNRRDGFLAKFNVEPLAVSRPRGAGEAATLGVFPNPVTTFATISIAFDARDAALEVRDALGRSVMRFDGLYGTEFILDCSQLAHGIYVCTLTENDKHIASGKMIVK